MKKVKIEHTESVLNTLIIGLCGHCESVKVSSHPSQNGWYQTEFSTYLEGVALKRLISWIKKVIKCEPRAQIFAIKVKVVEDTPSL